MAINNPMQIQKKHDQAINTWIPVDSYGHTYRMKVIGGWIVKYESSFNRTSHYGRDHEESISDPVYIPTMVFIPDPHHQWDQWSEIMVNEGNLSDLITDG